VIRRRAHSAATRGPGRRDNRTVHVAAVRFELHVPQSRSLKQKRAAIRPVVDALRHRYRLSVAEVDHHDTWQRAAIGVAVVAATPGRVEEVLDGVERYVASAPDVEVVSTEVTWLDTGDATARAWS
jgi:uncharacterized protein YlxP (DUF503 family)